MNIHTLPLRLSVKNIVTATLSALVFTIIFSSCKTTQETSYFKTLKKDTTITGFVSDDFESKIKMGDNLGIVVTSLNKIEDEIYNLAAGDITFNGGAGAQGYMVKDDGTILFHRLGSIPAAGMTRKELAKKIQTSLQPYLKDPIVNVNYLNHKVTVMGAVKSPQVINITGEQVSLIDVIVKSGDMAENAIYNDIMVIREDKDQKIVKHVNLEDHSILNSPWYYVQPNDIVYVRLDHQKTARAERRQNVQGTVALVASVVTVIVVVAQRIIK